ncbi:MAG: glycosyltransferase family 4 protein [Rhizobiaceae bacterium]
MTEERLKAKKVIFLVSEDYYFWSHRKSLAQACLREGAEVVVACRCSEHRQAIEELGIRVREIPFDRSGLNPWNDAKTLIQIAKILFTEKPDLLHNVAVKPVLYGSVAGFVFRIPKVINTLAGLGFLYISKKSAVKLIRGVFQFFLVKLSNRRNFRLVVQNRDDERYFLDAGVQQSNISTILGSGVDVTRFYPSDEPRSKPVAVCVARMLVDKGILELVEAARRLSKRGGNLSVRLVGGLDENPTSIRQSDIDSWLSEGIIEYAGHSNDIAGEYARSHIAVLPSYREGLPKSLLEAAASGKPMIATDVPGCREICINGETGLLVPARDSEALEEALEKLAKEPALRRKFGSAARILVESKLSSEKIDEEYLDLYGF